MNDLITGRAAPGCRLGEQAKSWWQDERFFADCEGLAPDVGFSAERKFFLLELLNQVAELEGDSAEAGVYQGASSWFICQARVGKGSCHYAFDSFEGLSAPQHDDGTYYWCAGDLSTGAESARRMLADFDATVVQGWIPEVFERGDRAHRLPISTLTYTSRLVPRWSSSTRG